MKNKFPNKPLPKEGKIIDYTLNDGKIKDIQGLRRMDFVIDKNGKFKIPCDVCGPMLNEMEIEVIEW